MNKVSYERTDSYEITLDISGIQKYVELRDECIDEVLTFIRGSWSEINLEVFGSDHYWSESDEYTVRIVYLDKDENGTHFRSLMKKVSGIIKGYEQMVRVNLEPTWLENNKESIAVWWPTFEELEGYERMGEYIYSHTRGAMISGDEGTVLFNFLSENLWDQRSVWWDSKEIWEKYAAWFFDDGAKYSASDLTQRQYIKSIYKKVVKPGENLPWEVLETFNSI